MKPTTLLRSVLLLAALSGAVFAADSTTIKLRRLELKSVPVKVQGQDKPVPFLYADAIKQVMLTTSTRGTSADELVSIIGVWLPIKKDIEAGKKELRLDQPAYDVVLRKVNSMEWAPPPDFAEVVAGFISYVRGLKEEEFDATPAAALPAK